MKHHLIPRYRSFLSIGLLAVALLAAALALPSLTRAAEVAADTKGTNVVKAVPKPKWQSTATLGATLTRGNSRNFLATGVVTSKRSWTNNEVLLNAAAGYGDTTTTSTTTTITPTGTTTSTSTHDTTTDSYIKGSAQWNHFFGEKLYAGLLVTGEHDDVAALAYRLTVNPLAGYYFIKQTNSSLAVELGPSYVREKFFDEPVNDYIALRLGERAEHKFVGGSRIWENVAIFPQVDDFSNYLIYAEAGVSAPISKALSLSVVLQDTYKSQPAPGKLKNDLKLIAGLTFTF